MKNKEQMKNKELAKILMENPDNEAVSYNCIIEEKDPITRWDITEMDGVTLINVS